jgi:hypothetical protein
MGWITVWGQPGEKVRETLSQQKSHKWWFPPCGRYREEDCSLKPVPRERRTKPWVKLIKVKKD